MSSHSRASKDSAHLLAYPIKYKKTKQNTAGAQLKKEEREMREMPVSIL